MRPGRRLRTAIIAVGLAAATLLGATGAGPTEAAWTDAEYIRGDAVSGGKLPAPTDALCNQTSIILLGLQSVTLRWSSTQQGAQRVEIRRPAGAGGTDIQGSADSVIEQTGQSGGLYHYQAIYTTSRLLGLIDLSNLLGGAYDIRIFNGAGTNWVSTPTSFRLNVILLGLGSSCSAITPGA